MARKKSAEGQPEGAETTAEGKVTKAAAVREALAQGVESPADICEFAKTKYGLEMAPAMASSYKSQIKAKAGQSAVHKRGGRPRKAEAAASTVSQNDVGIVADLAAVKRLVEKLGAGQVREMVGLFE
jgi:hypothetical protein